MILSMAIAIRDEEDLPSGHKRKKAGDIIAIKKGLWEWGWKERQQYLIVDIDVPVSAARKLARLMVPHYADGSFGDGPEDEFSPERTVLAKRRFSIPASVIQDKYPAWFSSVNWKRVQDPEDDYQPLRDSRKVVDMTLDRHNWIKDRVRNRLITQAEFDADLGD